MLWFLFLYLIAFPFGQLASFQLFSSARIHLTDIFAGILVFAWLTDILWKHLPTKKSKKTQKFEFARPLLSFLVISLFGLILAGFEQSAKNLGVGFLYFARLALYIALYFAVKHAVDGEEQREKIRETILDSMVILGFFISLMGIIGYFLYPDTKALSEYGWDNHYYRLIGPFLDPAFTGIIIVLSTIALWFKGWKKPGLQALAIVIFLVDWAAIALTYSRASYVGLGAYLLLAFIIRRNILVLVGVTLLLISTYYLLPHPNQSAGTNLARTSTITSRFDNYILAVKTGLEKPLFGIGYNLYKPKIQNEEKITHSGSGIHSSLLFVFVTTGVLGLLAYLGFWARVIRFAWWNRESKFAGILLCTCLALLGHSLFDNSLFYPWVMAWLAILLALQ